jgi:hypothetical protein
MVRVESGFHKLYDKTPCNVLANGVSPHLAIAMTVARVVDAKQEPVPCDIFCSTKDGVICTDSEGNTNSIMITSQKETAELIVNRKSVARYSKSATRLLNSTSSDTEEELELELDIS